MSALSGIFNWILTTSAMASALVGVILILKLLLRNKSGANWQYYIWFLLLIRLAVPIAPNSSISLFNIFNNTKAPAFIETITEKDNFINSYSLLSGNRFSSSIENNKTSQALQREKVKPSPEAKGPDLKEILLYVWLTGALMFSAYFIFINIKSKSKIKKSSKSIDDYYNRLFYDCKNKMNIRKNIPVFICNKIIVPSLEGIISPIILIPTGLLKTLSEEELRHIFMHELAHYKRRDLLTGWVIIILKTLHWFNFIIWYAFFKMRQDSEIACDYLAMSHMDTYEQKEYGYTIIHLMKLVSKPRIIPGTTGIIEGKSQIRRRINMIAKFKKSSLMWSTTGLVVLALISCILLTNANASDMYKETVSSTPTNVAQQVKNKNNITVSDVQGNSFKGKLITISDPKKITLGYDISVSKTTSTIAKENNALVAINAGGFQKTGQKAEPIGMIIHDGKVLFNESLESKKMDIVGFNDDGVLIVGNYSANDLIRNNIKEAVSFGPALIVNGKKLKLPDWGLQPRTAIGQKADGTVLFLVIDGRSQKSTGATLSDVQEIMLLSDAVNASNLDGGSSSTMYYNEEVINKPCDPSGEKAVPSVFMVRND